MNLIQNYYNNLFVQPDNTFVKSIISSDTEFNILYIPKSPKSYKMYSVHF